MCLSTPPPQQHMYNVSRRFQSSLTGHGRLGKVGGVWPGPVAVRFFVAQWLKRPQCVATRLCRQQQKHTMYVRMIINQPASFSQLVSKMVNEFLRSSRVQLSILSSGFRKRPLKSPRTTFLTLGSARNGATQMSSFCGNYQQRRDRRGTVISCSESP